MTKYLLQSMYLYFNSKFLNKTSQKSVEYCKLSKIFLTLKLSESKWFYFSATSVKITNWLKSCITFNNSCYWQRIAVADRRRHFPKYYSYRRKIFHREASWSSLSPANITSAVTFFYPRGDRKNAHRPFFNPISFIGKGRNCWPARV